MKKAANGRGSVERRGTTLWWARITAPGKPRKRLPVAGSEAWSKAQAKREAAKLAGDYAAGRIVFDETPRTKARPVTAGAAMTVRQVGEAWTSGKLYETFGAVDGLSPRKSGYIDGKTLAKHVYGVKTRGPNGPDFGDLPIADVSNEDARAVMGAQRPEDQALQTRRHTYARLRQVFDFAELPLKLRREGTNPFTKRMRPRKVKGVDITKDLAYWYPSEAVQFSGCTETPLGERVFCAVAVGSGFDKGTLLAPSWADYDAANRVLRVVRPKVGKTVFVRANPPWLFDLLDAWRELSGAPAADAPRELLQAAPIFPADVMGCRRGRETDVLQASMDRAGLDRAALYETTDHAQRMRFHDLRATFETWARRAGWDQRDIDARTGHASKAMAERYDRGARSLAELQEVPFPNLALAMPEIRATLATRLATSLEPTASETSAEVVQVAGITECEGRDLNPHASYGASTSS